MNIFKNRPLALISAVFLGTFYISFYLAVKLKLIICTLVFVFGLLFIIKKRFLTIACITVTFSLLFSFAYFDLYIASSENLIGQTVNMTFEVVDISFQNEGVVYFDGKEIDSNKPKLHFTLDKPENVIHQGDIISATVSVLQISSDDGFNTEQYYRSMGIVAEGNISQYNIIGHKEHPIKDLISACQKYCVNEFAEYTSDETSALLSALSIGDKSDIDGSILRDFSRCGISHLLAISGMHLSVIMGLFVVLLDLLPIGRRVSSVIIIVICIGFIMLSGASLSVLRAGSMFIIMLFGRLLRRMSDSLTSLFFGVSIIVLFSPSSVFDVGLILSFTSTLGIVIILPLYLLKLARIENLTLLRKLWSVVKVSVLTTMAAMAFSFVPLVCFFDGVSLVSVLANLVISPFMSILLCLIPIFLCVSYIPALAWMIGEIINIYVSVIYSITALISSIPNASVSLDHPFVIYTYASVIVGIIILFILRKSYAYLMPYLCWLTAFVVCFNAYNFLYFNSSDVVFYSEAGSDAILLRNQKGCVYLDLGRGSLAAERRSLAKFKNELWSFELDYWIIGDYSNVSWRGLSEVMNEFYVRNIVVPIPENAIDKVITDEIRHYSEEEGVKMIWFEYGKSFVCNGNSFTVYKPITFDNSSAVILSADVLCNDEIISYYGRGFFDNDVIRESCDYVYIGEFGSKRKQKSAPVISCEYSVIAENNDIASSNIKGESTFLTDESNFVKLRIG